MKSNSLLGIFRKLRTSRKARARAIVLGTSVLLSAACSVSTDGVVFVPDADYDSAGSDGATAGKGSGGSSAAAGKGSAGMDQQTGGKNAGGTSAGGTHSAGTHSGGTNSGGSNVGGTITAGSGGKISAAGSDAIGGSVSVAGSPGLGGANGVGGAISAGGTTGMPMSYPCVGKKPISPMIADFNIMSPAQMWTDSSGLAFNLYGFPDISMSKPNLKLGGGTSTLTIEANMVQQPMGAGVRMSPCVDARSPGYRGIQFTIYGSWSIASTMPMPMAIRIVTNQTQPANDMLREGTCVLPPNTTDPRRYCDSPHYDFQVPTSKLLVNLDFAKFTGGKPNDGVDTDQIKGIEWQLVWMVGQPAYNATVVLDDVSFY